MDPKYYFATWEEIGRVILISTCAYLGLVFLLRISGKRTLSKMNAFDLVVTVALGSTLATTLLSKDVAMIEGLVAFAMLIGLQFVITYFSVRSDTVIKLIKAEPTLLYHRGQFLPGAMKHQRVLEVEVRASVRSQGIAAMEQVEAVVLETDGSMTVIKRSDDDTEATALKNLDRTSQSG
ncbi:MAG: DUF421 domain-containing protein [Armatimonadaceae bacterium]